MKNKSAILLTAIVLFVCFVTLFFFIHAESPENSTRAMFPLWDGSDTLFPPYKSDVACIIQCEPMPLEGNEKKVSLQEPFWNYLIKTYSDKTDIQQLLNSLRNPETQTPFTVESRQSLLVVFISHTLNSQSAIRIPFQLDEDGHAITPRGKERTLYKVLHNGLEEWRAGQTAERNLDRAQALLFEYMQWVEKGRRETLSEAEYMATINNPLPFSTEEFKAFLIKKQEDPNAILSILKKTGNL